MSEDVMATIYGTAGDDYRIGTAGADLIYGDATGTNNPYETGNDQFHGYDGNDTIFGYAGDNVLIGGQGDDSLSALLGDDTLDGGTGKDALSYHVGSDSVSGGSGDDTIYAVGGDYDGSPRVDTLSGGDGIDELNCSAPLFFLGVRIDLRIVTQQDGYGAGKMILTGVENVVGSQRQDVITGNAGFNRIDGQGGEDTLDGGAGDDVVIGGEGSDWASFASSAVGVKVRLEYQGYYQNTGSGLDYLSGIENLLGSNFRDELVGDGASNRLRGGGGYDTLGGGLGDDRYILDGLSDPNAIDPGPVDPQANAAAAAFLTYDLVTEGENGGLDTVELHETAASAYALAANVENGELYLYDRGGTALHGNALGNRLTGNDYANALDGRAGADTMIGGLGDDVYGVDVAQDVATEVANGGVDTVVASLSWALGAELEKLTLSGAAVSGVGNELANTVTGHGGANRLFGMAGADILFGLGGQDSLNGGTGNDTLSGGAGLDTLVGGSGNDRIAGSTGADLISGQAGADRFVYLSTADSTYAAAGRDVIADFARAEGDRIELTSIDANASLAGNQAFAYIGAREFSAAGQLRWKAFEGFSLLYGDVNGDKTPDFAIRVDGVAGFALGDFLL